ncbi:10788_t:CDS:1 [Dentiscutata heterogama]|uniref:10788_t:CDS:1 n=1 Tax=Dentiscutata heterogama TaxID=1316150 RepID=A0ACA9LA81_9GLOM|nr:10788_t:CDS:1 [Dentiscutata heterogama]
MNTSTTKRKNSFDDKNSCKKVKPNDEKVKLSDEKVKPDDIISTLELFYDSNSTNASKKTKFMSDLNKMTFHQRKVVESVLVKRVNVCVSGPAGCGKSFVFDFLKEYALDLLKVNITMTGPTGISAVNINGTTINSALQLGGLINYNQINKKLSKEEYRQSIQMIKILLIDEISMVSVKMFKAISYIFEKVHKNNKSFGGIQVIIGGDFFQLPPVDEMIFDSLYWKGLNLEYIYLKDVFRQKDKDFVKVLNSIRCGKLSTNELNYLKRFQSPNTNYNGAIKLYYRNSDVNRVNTEVYNALKSTEVKFTARDSSEYHRIINDLELKYNGSDKAEKIKELKSKRDEACKNFYRETLSQKELYLKCGARIQVIKNLNDRVANGMLGTLRGWYKRDFNVKRNDNLDILDTFRMYKRDLGEGVRYEDYDPLVSLDKYPDRYFRIPKVSFDYLVSRASIGFGDLEGPDIKGYSRIQYPLKLAYASTVHKSQSLSIPKVDVYADGFDLSLFYTALSRVIDPLGLRLYNFNHKFLFVKIKQGKERIDKLKKFYNECFKIDPSKV